MDGCFAWYLQQALDEPLRWHVGSKIAAWASAIETGVWGVFGMDTQEDILWVKNESKVFCATCQQMAGGTDL